MQTAEGTSDSMITNGAIYVIPRVIVFYIILIILILLWKHLIKIKSNLSIKVKNKIFKISLIPLNNVIKVLLSILFLLSSLYYIYKSMGFDDYLDKNKKTTFFDTYYYNPKDVNIKAPEENQNLIYIYVESLETSLFSNQNGGNFKETIIPNLEKLASNNINFSNNEILGGAYPVYGTGWTIAGMVASSAGIPLKLPIDDANLYSGYGEFLPGAYSLGDILKDNGYKNYILLGSDATFGGRRDYYNYHGDYEIHDIYYAREQDWIPDDYYEWWGFEDKKLFEFAKEDLTEIAKKDEPFNFTMLTADTHATDGYLEKSCNNPYDEQYLNAYNCTDEILGDFIKWLKKQDFYENTTIVITGDHLTMQGNYMDMYTADDDKSYTRKIFNTFINSQVETDNYHNRAFTSFDIFPTTLVALGFEIPGNRLALGVNLFSEQETLTEEFGFDALDKELQKNSDFYNEKILGNTYDKLKEAETKIKNED